MSEGFYGDVQRNGVLLAKLALPKNEIFDTCADAKWSVTTGGIVKWMLMVSIDIK